MQTPKHLLVLAFAGLATLLGGCTSTAAESPGGDSTAVPSLLAPAQVSASPLRWEAAALMSAAEQQLRDRTGAECLGGADYLMSRSAETYRDIMASEGVAAGWNASRSIWLGSLANLDADPATDVVGSTGDEVWVLLERDGQQIAGRYVPLRDSADGRVYWVQDAIRVPIPCG